MDEAAVARALDRRWWTLGVLCFSLLVIGIDNTILNVALPTLQKKLGASNSDLQWMVDSYTLVFAGLLLTAGSLGDRYGRRRALAFGLVVFGVGSVLSAVAGSPGHLIVTRALMGIGGAFIMPATLSILTNVFTVAAERARAIAIWAGVSALGIAFGPVIGGWLLSHFWWGSVFLVNVPIVLIGLVGGRLYVPESRDPAPPRLDPVGAVLSIAGLTTLVYALINAGMPDVGWTSFSTVVALDVAAGLLATFVAWELHTDHPMLDVNFFRNPRFTAASTAITLVFFALFGTVYVLTSHLQFVLGYSPLQAGVRMMPVALVLMVAAPLSARLVERAGTKVVVAVGLGLVAAGLVWLSTVTTSSGYGLVLASMTVLGLGMGLTMAPATESIMGSLPRHKAGVGSAVNDTTRQVGGALGVAVLGTLLASSYTSKVASSFRAAGVPANVVNVARRSLGAAIGVGQRVGGGPGRALVRAARSAYVSGMGVGVLVAAGAAVIGALVVLIFLPARAPEPADVRMEEVPAETRELEMVGA